MNSEIVDGLWVIAIVSLATVVFIPVLCWILPPRQQMGG